MIKSVSIVIYMQGHRFGYNCVRGMNSGRLRKRSENPIYINQYYMVQYG